MKRILILQSRAKASSLEAERHSILRSVHDGAECVFLSTLDETIPWSNPEHVLNGYHGIIFGGSGDYDFDGGRPEDDPARITSRTLLARLTPLVEHLIANDIPTLGICYGHQLIAESRGGTVVHDLGQNKIGTHDVELTEEGTEDVLFNGLPPVFSAQYGHKDSVTSAPMGGTLLARGPRCSWSAIRYGKKVYTTQFHPEMTAEDVHARLEASPGYLPQEGVPEGFVRPSEHASLLIPRFIKHVVS